MIIVHDNQPYCIMGDGGDLLCMDWYGLDFDPSFWLLGFLSSN